MLFKLILVFRTIQCKLVEYTVYYNLVINKDTLLFIIGRHRYDVYFLQTKYLLDKMIERPNKYSI